MHHNHSTKRQHFAPRTLLPKYKVPQPIALRLSHFATVWLNLFSLAFPSLFLSVTNSIYFDLCWIYLSISICLATYIYINYTNNQSFNLVTLVRARMFGNLKIRIFYSSPRPGNVSCRPLEEMECKTPSGCSLTNITLQLHYITLH